MESVKPWQPPKMVVSDAHHLHHLQSCVSGRAANYGFAAAAGCDKDLGITHGTSSLSVRCSFSATVCSKCPGAIYVTAQQREEVDFFQLVLWGLCAAATGMVSIFRC